MKRPKATQNKAKDVVTPKQKYIDIPVVAKAEIARANLDINNYISGVVAGMGIKGKWSIDMRNLKIIVEDK